MKIKFYFTIIIFFITCNFSIALNRYVDTYPDKKFFDLNNSNMEDIVYIIGLQLENNINYFLDPTDGYILVTTLENEDDLNVTCKLSRIIQQGIEYYFTKKGYRVKEINLRKESVLIKKKRGEFVLTRDISLLLKEYSAQAIITGTYSFLSQNEVFITLKVISSIDNTAISALSFTLMVPSRYKSLILSEYITQKKKIKKKIEQTKGPIESGIKILSKKNKSDIKIIQTRLKELGLYNWKIDGIWGKRTQRALETFKKVVGLRPYNTWDLTTQKALFKGTNL